MHSPFNNADSRFIQNYPNLSGHALNFATLIEGMDKSLGDIMDKLQEIGAAEDTLVIFWSDNGSDAPISRPVAPLRGKKGHAYEGGIRVPLLIGWAQPDPDNQFQQNLQIPQASRCDDIVAIWDSFPTVLKAAGIDKNEIAEYDIDGHALQPYLRGEPGEHRPQEFLLNFPHPHQYEDYYALLRRGQWKIIYRYAEKRFELYELGNDIGEQNDLSDDHEFAPEFLQMARALMLQLKNSQYQPPRYRSDDSDAWVEMPPLDEYMHIDTDRNGTPDIIEVMIGTDPRNEDEGFRAFLGRGGEDGVAIIWPSLPDNRFTVETKLCLLDESWSTLVENYAADQGSIRTVFSLQEMDVDTRFFRVMYEVP